eukprot:11184087-Lingulodinium_polyedra.AAC.1
MPSATFAGCPRRRVVNSSAHARRLTRLSSCSARASQGASMTRSAKTASVRPGRMPELSIHAAPGAPSMRNRRAA